MCYLSNLYINPLFLGESLGGRGGGCQGTRGGGSVGVPIKSALLRCRQRLPRRALTRHERSKLMHAEASSATAVEFRNNTPPCHAIRNSCRVPQPVSGDFRRHRRAGLLIS